MAQAKIITQTTEAVFTVKGSKFIALAFPVASREQIDGIIAGLRKEHHRANHVCFAYRLGRVAPQEFSTDAGEPSGTAGKPILGVLQRVELCDALLAVVRYFGGTKLGIRGLIDAYGHTAGLAIAAAEVSTVTLCQRLTAAGPYGFIATLEYEVKQRGGRWLRADYGERVTVELAFPTAVYQQQQDWLAGLVGSGQVDELEETKEEWL